MIVADRKLLLLAVLVTPSPGAAVANEGAPLTGSEPPVRANDSFCAARCVKYVLRWYRDDEDLMRIIRRMQWPAPERGASLDAIAGMLAEHGIHTQALRVPSDAVVEWEKPVITHLTQFPAGHFVVLLPSEVRGKCRVWDGMRGIREVAQSDFSAERSGALLLTSDKPISDALGAVRARGAMSTGLVPFVSLGFCIVVAVLASMLMRRDTTWRFPIFQRRSL